MTVTIDDSLPPGPGNWLDLPKSAVPAWTALTLEERRQILAGRGPSLLINLIRHQTNAPPLTEPLRQVSGSTREQAQHS